MKKFVFVVIMFLAAAGTQVEAQSKKEDPMNTIVRLRDSLAREQMRLNHFIFEKYAEIGEAEDNILPTAAITVALARKDARIDSLRKAFEKIDQEAEEVFCQDTAYLAAQKRLMNREPGASEHFSKVRDQVFTKFCYSEGYKSWRKRRDEALYISNLEAFKLYVKINKEQNKYMDFKLNSVSVPRIMDHPEAKRISANIDLLERMIKIKEAELLYL